MEESKGISKKEIIRNYTQGFILASLFTTGIIIAFSTKIHWSWIILGVSFWAFFCGVLGIITYYYHKSNPQLSKKMNEPEIKKGFSDMNIYFGVFLIIMGFYQLFSGNTPEQKKFSLITIGFGILTILWGYLDARRLKNN